MRNHAASTVRKIDKLPISLANRNIAKANFAATEASIDRIARVLDRFREFAPASRKDHRATA